MGRIKSSESINTPEAFHGTAPQHVEQVPSYPPQHVEQVPSYSPQHVEQVPSYPPQQAEPVASFPPMSGPGQVEGNRTPTHFERVASFPPRSQPEDEGVAVFPPVSKLDQVEEVVNGQPRGYAPGTPGLQLPLGNPWTTGLFDCCDDPTSAIMTTIFPCVTFGQLAEILQSGNTTCAMGSLLYSLTMPLLIIPAVLGANYRKMLRVKFGLVEAPYPDLFTHYFCLCCALCQEFRELKNRGFDPALGWNGLMAKHMMIGNQQMNTPPPTQTMFH